MEGKTKIVEENGIRLTMGQPYGCKNVDLFKILKNIKKIYPKRQWCGIISLCKYLKYILILQIFMLNNKKRRINKRFGELQMIDNYSKAYKEVLEILKYVPQESVNKIPKEMINLFKTKMDKSWNFKVDINKPFEEQEILEETKAIFANIFRDYWATLEQRKRIEAREKYELEKIEEEKRKKL